MGPLGYPSGNNEGPGPSEERLARLAGRQKGLVATGQLRTSGVTRRAVLGRVRAGRHGFEADRERDATLVRHGVRTLRFSHEQIHRRAGTVAETVLSVLRPDATA